MELVGLYLGQEVELVGVDVGLEVGLVGVDVGQTLSLTLLVCQLDGPDLGPDP